MRLDFFRSKTARSRSVSALGIICAFLFTIALSDAPRLHEFFHKALGPDHECAVTMFTHGNCDRLTIDAPAAGPPTFTWSPLLISQQLSFIPGDLEFSLLEHAPPVFA